MHQFFILGQYAGRFSSLTFCWFRPTIGVLHPQRVSLIAMIKKPRTKRILSISLLSLGGILMFLAPEDIWVGAILFALGLGVEIAGLVLGHRK